MMGVRIDVSGCPECAQKGTYDGRVLICGRGIYRCPNGHRWQDANEKPTTKGVPLGGSVLVPATERPSRAVQQPSSSVRVQRGDAEFDRSEHGTSEGEES